MASEKRLARIAGLLYLLMAVAVVIGPAARGSVVVAGDAAATAGDIRLSDAVVRLGIVADLVSATIFLLTAMALYVLLRRVNGLAAAAMVVLVAVSVAIQALSLASETAALTIATGAGYTAALGPSASDAMVLLFVQAQHDGYLMSQMFFALWLLPLGYLVVVSGFIPRALGYLLAITCLGYLVDLAAYLLAPGIEPNVLPISAVAGVAGEFSFMAWLIVKGVRTPHAGPSVADAVRGPLVAAGGR